jgi:hypothetical protein
MWTLMIAQLLARDTYLHLTPQTKVKLEKRVSPQTMAEYPQVSPSEVSQILNGLHPQKCSKNPKQRNAQIICIWIEYERIIEVYYHGGDNFPRWTFQRWKASGSW